MSAPNTVFHAEPIELASKGWFYPNGHPLSSGHLDLFYMTASSEDLLTSRNLIQKGIVIDRLIESLIATPGVKLDDILLGDKAAIMVAARVMGYGKDYTVSISCPQCDQASEVSINLEELEDRDCPFFTQEYKGINEFPFELPVSKKNITFKFLTHADEMSIRAELASIKKLAKTDIDKEVTTRLSKIIVSIDRETNGAKIRSFVESMPARDARALREYLKQVTPDINLSSSFVCSNCGYEGRANMPIDSNFFWPNN